MHSKELRELSALLSSLASGTDVGKRGSQTQEPAASCFHQPRLPKSRGFADSDGKFALVCTKSGIFWGFRGNQWVSMETRCGFFLVSAVVYLQNYFTDSVSLRFVFSPSNMDELE